MQCSVKKMIRRLLKGCQHENTVLHLRNAKSCDTQDLSLQRALLVGMLSTYDPEGVPGQDSISQVPKAPTKAGLSLVSGQLVRVESLTWVEPQTESSTSCLRYALALLFDRLSPILLRIVSCTAVACHA